MKNVWQIAWFPFFGFYLVWAHRWVGELPVFMKIFLVLTKKIFFQLFIKMVIFLWNFEFWLEYTQFEYIYYNSHIWFNEISSFDQNNWKKYHEIYENFEDCCIAFGQRLFLTWLATENMLSEYLCFSICGIWRSIAYSFREMINKMIRIKNFKFYIQTKK